MSGVDDAPDEGLDDAHIDLGDTEELKDELPPPPEPYVFDERHGPLAGGIIDAALGGAPDGPEGWGLVEQVLKERGDVADGALSRELSAIGGRSLSTGTLTDPDTTFVADRVWPKPTEATEDVVKLWRAALDNATDPAAIARLEELLIVCRDGIVPARARNAALSYLASAKSLDDDLATCAYLTRAWSIARRFKFIDVEAAVLDHIEERVTHQKIRAHMGRVMPLVAVLCQTPSDRTRLPAQHDLAERVLAEIVAVETMHHIVAAASDLRRKIIGAGPDQDAARRTTRGDELAALRRIADVKGREPMVRQSHLETAAKYATSYNLQSELREIRRELEAVSSLVKLAKVSTSAHIPSWLPELEVHRYAVGYDWAQGLLHFLLSPAPCGDIAAIKANTRSRGFGLRHLFNTVLLGADMLPRKTLVTDEEKYHHDDCQHVSIASEHWGHVSARGLQRLAEKHGVPSEDELHSFFLNLFNCDPSGARILAKALRHFWFGDHLEAVYLAAPATEAAARRLLRELDEGVYQVQVGKNAGKYPALGTLLDELLTLELDESWHFFLTWLLLGPDGRNIRNDVAHGFTVETHPALAALVLRGAAVLITASGTVSDEGKQIHLVEQSVSDDLVDRTAAALSRSLLFWHACVELFRNRRREVKSAPLGTGGTREPTHRANGLRPGG